MLTHKDFIRLTAIFGCLLAVSECRRVRLTARPTTVSPVTNDREDNQPLSRQVLFYNPQDDSSQQELEEEDEPVVIAARQSNFNRPTPTAPTRIRSEHSAPKQPPVQTIRNFNKLNDDGSFTFGYEAADGSFKEETRGTDCVVRGKYGYIDPDGNKREFSYVSGNPCDPNAINQEEEDEEELKNKSNEEENIPENIPRRPNIPLRPVPIRSKPTTTTLFQQSFNNEAEEQDSQLELNIKQPLRQVYRNNLILDDELIPRQPRPTVRPRLAYQSQSPRLLTGRPTPATENQPATTYRPQIIQYPITSSATAIYPKQSPRPNYIATPTTPSTYFDEQFKKFHLESNSIPSSAQTPLSKPISSSNPIYSTELVYDPATGQYNTVVYQQIPKGSADLNINQKLPFAPTPQNLLPPQRSLSASSSTESPLYQQQLIQQQQANQVAQSQHLYNLQLRQQQQLQRFAPQESIIKQQRPQQPETVVQRYPPQPQRFSTSPQRFSNEPQKYGFAAGYPIPDPQQPFYYLNPSLTDERTGYASGQIESFLRGHHLPY